MSTQALERVQELFEEVQSDFGHINNLGGVYGWGWEGGIAAVAKSEASSRRSGGGVELVQE